ncbi:MAG: lamin tail domain-containing protein [Anaerolineaceae bacterium]|nr:lamin tail domain-containing protein [Anaerolineaceae bacterium]
MTNRRLTHAAALIALLFLFIPSVSAANPPGAGDVLINEYVANSSTEWVELYNTTANDLDLSGHYIDDIASGGGAPKVIPNNTIISAGGYYVMEFSSFLNNGGDDVRFLNPSQAALDSTSYSSSTAEQSWYRSPDGGIWSTTESSSPTKGTANPGTGNPPGPGDVLINEYVANSGVTEWVELYNTTGSDLDLDGHYIDDVASGGGSPQAIPSNTVIPAGGFYVLEFTNLLNNGGDDVRFLDPSQAVLDSTSFGSATGEHSWFRTPDGGAWSGEETDTPTKGSSNTPPPGVGDVVINEYVANSATEWVELYNTTTTALDISGHYIDDIASGGGAPKPIPADTVIGPGSFYVLEFSSLLNNGGDDVRFIDPSQTTVLDSTSYGSATAEYSRYRFPDGGTWSGVESDTPTKGSPNVGTGDTAWTPGTFEIRIFDVEQGDSQLIIFPSGFSILIDVREASWNTGAGAAFIAQKIRTITGGSHVNVGILSHHHLDHIGYAGYGGFWGLIETEGITFDKIVDRDAGVWVDGLNGGASDGLCDPDLEIEWHNAGTSSGTSRNWICYATNPANTNIYPIHELAQLGSTTQIDPPDTGAVVEIVQVDGDGVTLVDGVTPIQGDHTGDATPPSENDYSIGLKIRFGLIDYATAGDSDGEYDTSQFGYTYNDVETVLASRFGQVDVLRANHHGSDHSTSQDYVDTLNPDASAISCGSNTFGHPSQRVVDALLGTGDVYLTNTCTTATDYTGTVIVDGDIILQSSDGVNYTIDGNAYVASDPASAYGMDDIVINEIMPNPNGSDPEWVELFNPTPQNIDISGMWLDDISGGGASPIQVPTSTTITAGGYWTLDTSSVFNNGGDDVRLLLPDGSTVVDTYSYGNSAKGKSWYRTPDGGSWAGSMTTNTTKGAANP